jgi:hypothetical protein
MPSLPCPAVPFYRNPTFRPGLAALVGLLRERSYSSHAIGRIFDSVAASGTLEGSLVEPDDMADAEAAFVDNLPEIPFDSPVWGDEMPPISGGSPGHLDGDRRDFEEWLSQVDASYPPADQPESDFPRVKTMADVRADMADVRRWYADHPSPA